MSNERQELADAMATHGIPGYMQAGISQHVFEGGATGHFLKALFSNAGWATLLLLADDKNRHLLPNYWSLLWQITCVVPRDCWGSPEKVKAWQERGGLKGGDSDSDA